MVGCNHKHGTYGLLDVCACRGAERDSDKYGRMGALRAAWLAAHDRELAAVPHVRLCTEGRGADDVAAELREHVARLQDGSI